MSGNRSQIRVGQIESVDIRAVWADEARDLTPWLAENPDLLGEALGMDLEFEGQEVSVGPFSADLLFRAGDGAAVVVENMINPTDHDHLGKIITYAAGLDAACAVLVAERFRPEHRSALEWLNRHSTDEVSFFGIELEVWKIGDSDPAPRLDVVVQPDEWAREVRATAGHLTLTQELYRKFWTMFLAAFHEAYPGWSNGKTPPKGSWIDFPAAGTGTRYRASFNLGQGYTGFRVELYLDTGEEVETRAVFDDVCAFISGDPEQLSIEIVKEELETKRASRVAAYYPSPVRVNDTDQWPSVQEWALKNLGTLRDTFDPFLEGL